jgi:hypothetical protein
VEGWALEAATLATFITELRGGMSKRAFAAACKIDRGDLTRVEQGEILVPPDMADKIDAFCRTGGEVLRRRRRVDDMRAGRSEPAHTGGELTAWRARLAPAPRRRAEAEREEDPTDRRALLTGLAVTAAEVSGTITLSGKVDPGFLFAAQRRLDGYAVAYATTPHTDLLPALGRDWRTVTGLLTDPWALGAQRPEYVRLAGRQTYLLSRIAFSTGDFDQAAEFTKLAGHHAEEADDPGLRAAIAHVWSSLWYYTGHFPLAVKTATDGLRWRQPYMDAKLHAYVALGCAQLGDSAGARTALDRMETAAGPAETFDEADATRVRGSSLACLGDSARAVPLTTTAVRRYEAMENPPFEGHGLTHLSYATAVLPVDPTEAARAASRALEVIEGRPTRSVIQRAWEVAHDLGPHASMPDVRDFIDRLHAAPRLALPAGPGGAT